MILSLLAAVVMTGTEPSAAGLADRFVQVQESLPGQQPTYQGWTRRQLEAEMRRLDDLRPSLGGPISMMAIGAAVAVVDFVVFLFGGLIALLSGGGFDTGVVVVMGIGAVVAAGLIILGAILLKGISKERGDYGRQMDLVKAAIEALTPSPMEPPPQPPPSMQTPFPMQVMATPLFITVTLARF